MNRENVQSEKKYSPFQWILFVFIIPLFFAITVVLIVLSVSGINVFEGMKNIGEKIPVVSSFIDSDDKEGKSSEPDYKKRYGELQSELKNQEAYIKLVENKLKEKEDEIQELMLENERLISQLEELELKNENRNLELKEIVKTYESMSSKKAAAILVEMEDEKALQILSNLKANTLAAVLEKMPPEDAAKFTSLLANE